MPPILHPRSRSTSTLFTTTLAVSFLVAGLPHLLPCPVNPRQFADTIEGPDGQPIKRRRRRREQSAESSEEGLGPVVEGATMMESTKKRECPVPKPGGLVGQIMGFKDGEREKPSEVVVKDLQGRKVGMGKRDEVEMP